MEVCSRCGHDAEAGATSCPHCGEVHDEVRAPCAMNRRDAILVIACVHLLATLALGWHAAMLPGGYADSPWLGYAFYLLVPFWALGSAFSRVLGLFDVGTGGGIQWIWSVILPLASAFLWGWVLATLWGWLRRRRARD